jgi:hypothetical protein
MYYREQDIIDWAIAKGIIDAADRLTQSLKTIEEIAELITHHLKQQPVMDDIGDIYVTIVVQAHMNGYDIQEIHENPYQFDKNETVKEQIATMVMDAAMLSDSIMTDYPTEYWISNIYNGLIVICDKLELSFPMCIDLAYKEIKGRTGKMVDGVFVKNE